MKSSARHAASPGTWRVGRVATVDLLIKPSLLIMGAILVVVFEPRFDEQVDGNGYVLASVFVVALYVSVLVHELAHVVVARRFGMRVQSVTLHLLGGETVIEGESRSPWQELSTAIVGPIASLAIGALAFAAQRSTDGTTLSVLYAVAYVNVIVAVFNMLPGLPLDGGRVFRAIVWQVTGREETGIRIAAWIGRATALALLAYALTRDRDDRQFGINVAIALLVALFLWQGAGSALKNAGRTARVNRLDARALADPDVDAPSDATRLSASLRGADLLRAMAATPADSYLLTETDGSVYGVLTARAVDDAYREGR